MIKCKICLQMGESYAGLVCKSCRNKQVSAQRKKRLSDPEYAARYRVKDRDVHKVKWSLLSEEEKTAIREKNKNRARIHRRRYYLIKYGLTPEKWDEIFASQGCKCAICKTDKPDAKGWATDHCHKNVHFRGILCNACNRAIGMLKESTTVMEAAISYLKKHSIAQ